MEGAVEVYKIGDELASSLMMQYDKWRALRVDIEQEWSETQNMIFATDAAQSVGVEASSTWKNNSTRGKLAQIRDNLHANYSSAILGNREWLKWEAINRSEDVVRQKTTIQAYMRNKLALSGFDRVVDLLLLDYIDKGVAMASCRYVTKTTTVVDKATKAKTEKIVYTGVEAVRHDPLDVIINPTAESISDSPQFIRKLVTIGDLLMMRDSMKADEAFKHNINNMLEIRKSASGGSNADTLKNLEYSVQGFGSYTDYLSSGTVELIEYHGNIVEGDTLKKNRRVVIADRCIVLVNEEDDMYPSNSFIKMAGWRDRPNNLYAQSPLAKLIGMQFRLDKLENTKSDALDLSVEPPIVISGEVEDFDWSPAARIRVDVDGQVRELGTTLNGVIAAQNEISALETAMEEFAGAPKQAMGFRTAGEKTAFEVQSLQTAGSRIFQQKVAKFERELLEPLLNDMLSLSRYYISSTEEIKRIDPDLNIEDFINVKKEDLVTSGYIRAVGSRHFAMKSQLTQELNALAASPLFQMIQPHISGKAVAALVSDLLDLDKYGVYQKFKGIEEQAEMQQHMAELQQQAAVMQQETLMPTEQDLIALGGGRNVPS